MLPLSSGPTSRTRSDPSPRSRSWDRALYTLTPGEVGQDREAYSARRFSGVSAADQPDAQIGAAAYT
eukprot:SAG11_NODE_17954_length_504_cov_1.269136_1_plen_66_part_01